MSTLKLSLVCVVFLLLSNVCSSQNYIGSNKSEIFRLAKTELKGFLFTKEVQNKNRSFIKFENYPDEQTVIFMLNSKGYCTSVSQMYNVWLFDSVKKELSKKYGKDKNCVWIETKDSAKYEVSLVKGKWFITVITKQKQK
jgi:hypothetical protein